MSIKAYQTAQDKVTDPRRVEIMMFQKCNALMSDAVVARSGPANPTQPLDAVKRAAQALFENDRLWMSLLADLASDENRLDTALRARLISLGLWACRYSDKVRADRAAPLDPLIHLNSEMIAGLTASLAASHSALPANFGAGAGTAMGAVRT